MNKTSTTARKYITAQTIRRANQQLMARGRDYEPSPEVRALMPSREVILKAANNALKRCMDGRNERLKSYLDEQGKGSTELS